MDKKTWFRIRYLFRKSNGLCAKCGKQQPETSGATCKTCRDYMSAKNRANRSNPDLCSRCHKSKDDSLKSMCDSCRQSTKLQGAFKRGSECGRWIGNVRTTSHEIANGTNGGKRRISSRHLTWNHQDFCNAFPAYKESGKQLDHIIPLACAETESGELDMEFGELALKLENIQLLTPSENVKKAKNIERQIKARALALRQQGQHGAELFHQIWAEFAYPQRQEEGNQDALPNG